MKLVLFDLETTGTDSVKHGVHQISGKIIINGEVKESFDIKVRPKEGAVYDEQALEIGKVTKEQLQAYPPMREGYTKLVAILDKYVSKYDKTDKFFLVGYNNAHFDNQFFRQFFMDNGNKYFGSYFWSNSLDCMVLASAALIEKRKYMADFKQATVAKELGVVIDAEKLHDAAYDIELCHAIYDKVCGKY